MSSSLKNEAAADLRGGPILDALAAARIEFVVSVPDIVTSEGLLRPLTCDPRFRLLRVCKEDEGISICAALAFCDRRALLLMQNTGLFDSINALRAVGVEYAQPVCMMIGLQGKEPALLPAASAKYSVRIVEPLLDVLGVARHLIQDPADIGGIAAAIERAYERSAPLALIVGRSPAP
jgi:sulfopyruvate decarboxylase subunit beta